MFTLIALSPAAPKPEGAARQGSISRPVLPGKTAKGLMQDGQDADIRSSQGYKELKQSLKVEEQNVSSASSPSVWEEWNY